MYYGLSRVLLWGLTLFGLWFIDPISGRFFVLVGVYPKENKNAHERKGEKITTATKYESLIQVLAGWLLLLLRFISRSTRKKKKRVLERVQ
jgi:hypothetical protein